MDAEQHTASTYNEAIVGVRGGIAEEALSCYHSVSGGLGLTRSECTHSREHGSVDSSSIIKEGAYYDLEFFGLGLGSRARSIYG